MDLSQNSGRLLNADRGILESWLNPGNRDCAVRKTIQVHERVNLEKAIRRVIPSTARLTYNPIFKVIVDSFDLLPKLMYEEVSKIPPNHMRIRVGVANRFLSNDISYINLGKDFWMHAFHAGLCRLDSTIVDLG